MPATDDSTYVGPDVPSALGEQLQHLLALAVRPRTFGDYVHAMAALVETVGFGVDLTDLCTTDASPHRATFGENRHQYHCVLDAIVVPFLADDPDTVHVRTVCPVTGDPVRFTVTASTVDVTPDDAVQSFGVARDVQSPSTDAPTPALAYRCVCPYAKTFATRPAYTRWARETDAHTMRLEITDAVELARALAAVA